MNAVRKNKVTVILTLVVLLTVSATGKSFCSAFQELLTARELPGWLRHIS